MGTPPERTQSSRTRQPARKALERGARQGLHKDPVVTAGFFAGSAEWNKAQDAARRPRIGCGRTILEEGPMSVGKRRMRFLAATVLAAVLGICSRGAARTLRANPAGGNIVAQTADSGAAPYV